MPASEKANGQQGVSSSGRRSFFYTLFGGLVAAIAGWISGGLPPGGAPPEDAEPSPTPEPDRISALEAEVARLAEALVGAGMTQPLAELEGEFNERIVFNKRELTVANPEGVLVNLVATRGHVGFRFYKDFGFGNEQVTSPWSIFIEGVEGYQGLAFLRDWRFTAALWDEDGKLLLGRLHPHPPANEPAGARFHVRGTVDEVQTLIEASADQASDVFQVRGRSHATDLAVDSAGNLVVGSREDPKDIILHDTADGSAYSLRVTGGQLGLTRIE
jgi:hypothetical protein